MTYDQKMNRIEAVRNLVGAGVYRRMATSFRIYPDMRGEYLDIARGKLREAIEDRRYATQAGWKLP